MLRSLQCTSYLCRDNLTRLTCSIPVSGSGQLLQRFLEIWEAAPRRDQGLQQLAACALSGTLQYLHGFLRKQPHPM